MTRFTPSEKLAFLKLESSERPMHFSAMQLFRPPPAAEPGFARETYEAIRALRGVKPLYAGHPAETRRGTSLMRWTYDDDIDIDYHLRYTRVPAPGGLRDLLALGDELHAPPLDRRKPLWECHVIDGLDDGRFALLYKVHHALMDGMSWANQMHAALSTDPADSRVRVGWIQEPEAADRVRPSRPRPARRVQPAQVMSSFRRSVSSMKAAMKEPRLIPAFHAPRTVLDVESSATVRRGWHSWPIQRIQDLASAAGVTHNDVTLAMVSGALRTFLAEMDALPDKTLVAMVPVDLRNEQDDDAENILGIALCNLATDLDEADERLAAIHASMQYNKQIIRDLPRKVAIILGGLVCAPISGDTGLRAKIPPMYNVYVSNVRGKSKPLYRNGALLEAAYGWAPMLPHQALMFGTHSNPHTLEFGIAGCESILKDPERLLGQLESSLKDLERAVGL